MILKPVARGGLLCFGPSRARASPSSGPSFGCSPGAMSTGSGARRGRPPLPEGLWTGDQGRLRPVVGQLAWGRKAAWAGWRVSWLQSTSKAGAPHACRRRGSDPKAAVHSVGSTSAGLRSVRHGTLEPRPHCRSHQPFEGQPHRGLDLSRGARRRPRCGDLSHVAKKGTLEVSVEPFQRLAAKTKIEVRRRARLSRRPSVGETEVRISS